MEVQPDDLPSFVRERKLCVEDELLRNRDRIRRRCILEDIAEDSAESFPILPLIESITCLSDYSPFPGVYLIYYVGKTSLYGGQVKSCRVKPIYVGMSKSNILTRLRDCRRKLNNTKDFKLEDFAVRCIIVDINHYALAIENALLKLYSPLWNDEDVAFCFGNADGDSNKWNKYHVRKDEDVMKNMKYRVGEYKKKRRPSAQSDDHTSAAI